MKLNYLFNEFKDCERAAKASLLKSKQRRKQAYQHSIEALKNDRTRTNASNSREKWASDLAAKHNLNTSAHKSNPSLVPTAQTKPNLYNNNLRNIMGLDSVVSSADNYENRTVVHQPNRLTS